jgi:uncharacterized NAD(P)/FAD-binding protein YdhS
MSEPFTIAIVGAGFSGVMTAVHLLRGDCPRPLRVVMVNRSGSMARGVAYGTNSPAHLLNVPAGKMSALPDDPAHFLRFAQSRDPSVAPGTFVRRSVYGEYIEHLLTESAARRPHSLEQVVTEVRGLKPDRAWATIVTADGQHIMADRVVMAVGHYPPAHPSGFSAEFVASPYYIRDPWTAGAIESVPAGSTVLLIGTGLTTLDVALALSARGVKGAVAVSRRGLLPRTHDPKVSPAEASHRPPEIESARTAAAYLRAVRRQVRAVEVAGGDWRQVIDSLRGITPKLWQRLSPKERERFMRHARPFWEVHRHRASPETGAATEELLRSGWLTVFAGRLAGAEVVNAQAEVAVRLRSGERKVIRVGSVLNCTGPATDVRTVGDPLLDYLFHWGQARPDPLGLGIDVSEDGAVISRLGEPSQVLYYVGPLLRARDGEGTAVPELRVYAQRLARTILESVPEPPRKEVPAWPTLAFDPQV